MHEMFELGMEWWEFVVRAVAVYVVVLLLTRMSGKRSMGQSTPVRHPRDRAAGHGRAELADR